MPDEKKAPDLLTDHSWSVSIPSRGLRVETSTLDADSFDFIDTSDQDADLMTLTWAEFEALYNKVKERRELFSKLTEKKG